MRSIAFAIVVLLGGFAVTTPSHAVTCANGVYRAGCAGPKGVAVVKKHPAYRYRAPVRGCAAGPYRAGCAGPNGAAVVRRPY